MPTQLTKVRGDLDLSDWTIPTVELLSEQLTSALSPNIGAAVRDTFDAAVEHGSEICFGIICEEDADPLSITLSLRDIATNKAPIQKDTDLVYRFSLREALSDDLDECRSDRSLLDKLKSVSAAMKQLAADIDAATDEQDDE